MACRGVAFAIEAKKQIALSNLSGNDRQLIEYIQSDIEEKWDADHLVEFDKSWDAMHRCLTVGQLHVDPNDTSYPLGHCVLYGESLVSPASNYIVTLKNTRVVNDLAEALPKVTYDFFVGKYKGIEGYALEWGEEDLEYTWDFFEVVRNFYIQAAHDNRAVIFTVDQ